MKMMDEVTPRRRRRSSILPPLLPPLLDGAFASTS
jgi:hypothetical protein